MTLSLLIAYVKKLMDKKWTGQIRVNLHKGDLSARAGRYDVIDIEKDSHHLEREGG